MRPFMRFCRAILGLRGKLALAFLLLGLPTGAALAWMTPLGCVPDEPGHFARAEGLLYGQFLGFRFPPSTPIWPLVPRAGVITDISAIPVALTEAFGTQEGHALTLDQRRKAEAIRWGGQISDFPTQMVQYFPAFYLPASAGLWLGRASGLSPLQSAFLGRLCMLASYLAMGFLALRLARFGQALLFAMLLLPVSLMLAASFSQDGQLIAGSALAAALLTRAGPRPGLAWGLGLALLGLIVCSKPPYAPFLGLCLLPLARPGLWARLCISVAVLCLPLGWMWLMTSCCYTDWPTLPYHPGPLWPGPATAMFQSASAAANLEVFQAHPAQILILLLHLLLTHGVDLWRSMIGGLNWNTVHLPAWQIDLWTLALASAGLACMAQPGPGPRLRETVWVALLLVAAYFGVALALYLSWSPVGAAKITGVNGRYFLLFWPAVLFLLPRWSGCRALELLGLAPALLMAAADVWTLPAFSWQIYRMFGP